ncbi:MAG: dTDP-4-dehydrorhamnose reductase [Actinomycetota bacterium]|nr:dTDP-4-dehydrorhamnose reductase [Actinomycetota bacterium]PLS75946.1 MAG: dTDP-4-dehydrorhamnose reductase [Actinomycetota bacterium]
MRVLITGAEGQVGRELVEAFEGHAVDGVVATGRRQLDVADRDSVLQAICSVRPDAVVHAAAWTDVDGCEGDPGRALQVNALGTRHVAEAARLAGARLCYLSTDYVFAGDAATPYTEWDQTGPRSVYGRSKLGGERELGPDATIVRTSWVCGRHGRNFVRTILAAAAERDELAVVDDQHGCPTFADDLAAMIVRLVVSRLPGTFHVTNQGATTWYGLATAALEAAGLDPAKVKPIATADLDPPRPAPRPAWSVLDNAALRLCGIPLLPDFHEPLERLVKQVAV